MKKTLIFLIAFMLSMNIFADPKGDEIAKKHYALLESKNTTSVGTMVLINSRGEKKIRKLHMYSQDGKDGRDSFIEFMEPADVKGSKFLTIGHKEGDDEQRLYLPALGKVRRISSSKKGGSFMGSDLNYFDMEDHDFVDFTYQYLKDEDYKGRACSVIEMYPQDKNAPYSKQIAWIGKDDHFIYKVECYDKKKGNKHMKTIVFLDVKSYSGILIAGKIVVDHHIDKHKTLWQQTGIKVNVGLKSSIFSVQNLTR